MICAKSAVPPKASPASRKSLVTVLMLTPVMRVMALMTLAADGERTWRLGTRLRLQPALDLSLEAARRDLAAAQYAASG